MSPRFNFVSDERRIIPLFGDGEFNKQSMPVFERKECPPAEYSVRDEFRSQKA